MKVLLTASVLSHICQFHKPLIALLKEAGHSVHIAARDNLAEKNGLSLPEVDAVYNINFHRSPFSPKNIPAYKELKRIIDREQFDIIHCNTPAVGVLTRLAARQTRKKNGTKVFYTAHGFHFYQGAPLKNWLMYYPIEKFMCRYTDKLITICDEDFQLASNNFNVNVSRTHGVGASSARFYPVSDAEKAKIRENLGLSTQETIILCTGELLKNKNQATLLRALPSILVKHPDVRVLLAGNGPEKANLEQLAQQLAVSNKVDMLGYRTDLDQLVKAADIIVSCSFREGLPLNIMEGMLCAKSIVASINRGHKELIIHKTHGLLFPPSDTDALSNAITYMLTSQLTASALAQAAAKKAQQYSDSSVIKELAKIYNMRKND